MIRSLAAAPGRPIGSRADEFFGPFLGAHNLNCGSAKHRLPGFVNLDVSPNVGADVVHDLEDLPLPFLPETFDAVFGSHVFEHIHRERFIPLVGDLVRILKPGGFLISVTPYCSSDDAIDNPFHLQAFSETTWHYADRRLYEDETTAGYGDFGVTWSLPVVFTALIPYPEYATATPDALEYAKRHYRNVIQELHVVLKKPE